MRQRLSGGYELDDDRERVDVAELHRFLRDAHGLYAKLGFGQPSERLMERP